MFPFNNVYSSITALCYCMNILANAFQHHFLVALDADFVPGLFIYSILIATEGLLSPYFYPTPQFLFGGTVHVQRQVTSLLSFSTSSDHTLLLPSLIVQHPYEAVKISAGSSPDILMDKIRVQEVCNAASYACNTRVQSISPSTTLQKEQLS